MKKISSILLSLGLVVGLCPLGILSHTALNEPRPIQVQADDHAFEETPKDRTALVGEQLYFTFSVNFDAISYVIRTKGQNQDHFEIYAENHETLPARSLVSFALREDTVWQTECYVTVFYGSNMGEYVETDIFTATWVEEIYEVTFAMGPHFENCFARVAPGASMYDAIVQSNLAQSVF